MMSVHREKFSKGKQGFIEREIDHFGRNPRHLRSLFLRDAGKSCYKVIICVFVEEQCFSENKYLSSKMCG